MRLVTLHALGMLQFPPFYGQERLPRTGQPPGPGAAPAGRRSCVLGPKCLWRGHPAPVSREHRPLRPVRFRPIADITGKGDSNPESVRHIPVELQL